MSKAALVLGLLFLGSLAGNAVMFRRLKTATPEARPSAAAARPGELAAYVQPSAAASSDPVAAELAALRREVSDLKVRLAAGGAISPSGDSGVHAVSAPDAARPEGSPGWVTDMLVEQEQMDRFWANVDKLGRATKGDTYRTAVSEYTADFLGLQEPARSSFIQLAAQSAAAMERAQQDYNDAVKQVKWDKANPQAYQLNQQEASRKFQEAQKAIQDQVKAALPQTTSVQKRFADQVPMWLGQMKENHGGKRVRSSSSQMEW